LTLRQLLEKRIVHPVLLQSVIATITSVGVNGRCTALLSR
jgi:hypothetical protein